MDFFPKAYWGVDGQDRVSLPYYLYLYINLYFYFVLLMFINEIFYSVQKKIYSKQTKILMKIQTCLWILKVST